MASMRFLSTLNVADWIGFSCVLALGGPFVVYTDLKHLDEMREIEANKRSEEDVQQAGS